MEAILHSGVAALSLRSRVSLRFGGVVGYKPFTTMREQENLLSSQLAVFERVAVCVFFATRVWDLYITTFAIAAKAPEHRSEDNCFLQLALQFFQIERIVSTTTMTGKITTNARTPSTLILASPSP